MALHKPGTNIHQEALEPFLSLLLLVCLLSFAILDLVAPYFGGINSFFIVPAVQPQ